MNMILNGFTSKPNNKLDVNITNPANQNEVVGKVWLAEKGDEVAILNAAQVGFDEWSSYPLSKRADILMRYADLLEENAERIAKIQCKEMGKIISECIPEVMGSARITRGFVERAKHLYGNTFCDNHPGLEHDVLFTKREPIGVFLCIVPFNYPVELYTHKVIPALIMGNSTIIKVSSDNPLAKIEMTKLLIKAGVPANAVGVIYGKRDFISECIIPSPRIQAITLTGSTTAGIKIYQESAPELHRVFLELGGNDPLIIFEDANLDTAVEEIMGGRISNTGQTCCASKRFIVHESIYDELVEKFVERLKGLKRGDPSNPETEIGCILNENNANSIIEQIEHTLQQGARCAYGGTVSNGTFVEPTVLVDVTPDMDIAGEMEIFGPVVPFIPFSTTQQAIDIANQSPYGLQAGILSANTIRALNVASMLKCGSVVVNGSGNYRHMDMPFGGPKMTGIGREGISSTLEEYSQEKTYIIKNALGII